VVDTATSADSLTATAATSLSWSHTTSGVDRYLVVGVSLRLSTVPPNEERVASVTYNGDALTLIGSQTGLGSFSSRIEMWGLVNPDLGGPFTILVTMASNGTGTARIVGGAVSFTGVDQNMPLGTFVPATSVSSTPSVTVSSSMKSSSIPLASATSPQH